MVDVRKRKVANSNYIKGQQMTLCSKEWKYRVVAIEDSELLDDAEFAQNIC